MLPDGAPLLLFAYRGRLVTWPIFWVLPNSDPLDVRPVVCSVPTFDFFQTDHSFVVSDYILSIPVWFVLPLHFIEVVDVSQPGQATSHILPMPVLIILLTLAFLLLCYSYSSGLLALQVRVREGLLLLFALDLHCGHHFLANLPHHSFFNLGQIRTAAELNWFKSRRLRQARGPSTTGWLRGYRRHASR